MFESKKTTQTEMPDTELLQKKVSRESPAAKDAEVLKEKKVSSEEGEVRALELRGEQSIEPKNLSVAVSAEELEEIKGLTGVKEKLDKINGKARKLLEEMKAKIKMVAVIGMSATALAGAGEFEAVGAETPDSATKIASLEKNHAPTENSGAENQKKYDENIDELRDATFTGKNEKFELVFRNKGKIEFLKSEGKSNFGTIPLDKVAEQLKAGAEKIEIIHTHPLAAYPGYSEARIAKIKKGEVDARPMPPSNTDFVSLINELNQFKNSNKRIMNKVIDPTGEWEFTLDEKNGFIDRYSEFMSYMENSSEDDFKRKELGLSDDEIKSLQSKGDEIENTHPENRMLVLQNDPETKKIADKINERFLTKENELFSKQEQAEFDEIFGNEPTSLAVKISKFSLIESKEDVKKMIDEYIERAKKLGINVTYKQFDDKK